MRANLGILLVILAVFMLVTADSDGQVISIEPASVESPAAGEQLTLNINIVDGVNVAGYEVTVTFDSTALSAVSIVNGDYLPDGAIVVPPVVTETSVKLAAASIGATVEGDGTLATMTFTVVEAKDSAIGLDAIITDPTATAIVSVVQDGTVTGPAVETPTPIEDNDANAVIGTWAVQSFDGETIEEAFGDLDFEGTEASFFSEWTFYENGRWNWVTELDIGTEDPFSGSFSLDIGGTYTITGSSYTLTFDEEAIEFLEIEAGEERTTGTWIKEGSTLTLIDDDDGTVIIMHAVDTAADPPKPPIKVPRPVASTHQFELELAAGLNMISLPLMPAEPYTASSFAAAIGATVVIQLDTAQSQFVGFTADQAGDGFAIEGWARLHRQRPRRWYGLFYRDRVGAHGRNSGCTERSTSEHGVGVCPQR